MEKVIIVNEDDKIIGHKERNNLNPEDIFRGTALWIKNSKGDILLAQRALTKGYKSGKWGPAVTGTVNEGETYDSNIKKEADEELGLKNIKFDKSKKIRKRGIKNYFLQWYITIVDKDISEFAIQKDEVKDIKWYSRNELIEEVKSDPDKFLNTIRKCITWLE